MKLSFACKSSKEIIKERQSSASDFFRNSTIKICMEGLIFSDKAHSSLIRYVNRQNPRFRAGNNPIEIMKVPLYSERVNSIVCFNAGKII